MDGAKKARTESVDVGIHPVDRLTASLLGARRKEVGLHFKGKRTKPEDRYNSKEDTRQQVKYGHREAHHLLDIFMSDDS